MYTGFANPFFVRAFSLMFIKYRFQSATLGMVTYWITFATQLYKAMLSRYRQKQFSTCVTTAAGLLLSDRRGDKTMRAECGSCLFPRLSWQHFKILFDFIQRAHAQKKKDEAGTWGSPTLLVSQGFHKKRSICYIVPTYPL